MRLANSSYAANDGILHRQHLHLYLLEDIAEAGEQEVVEAGRGNRCQSDSVPVARVSARNRGKVVTSHDLNHFRGRNRFVAPPVVVYSLGCSN